MTLDDTLWDLDKARKRLQEPQGRVARRNARNVFMAALRKARSALDTEYPVMRKPVIKRKQKRHGVNLVRGMAPVDGPEQRRLLMAGVSPNQFKTITVPGSGNKSVKRTYIKLWMVRALEHGFAYDYVAKAVRSRKVRRQIDSSIRLGRPRP